MEAERRGGREAHGMAEQGRSSVGGGKKLKRLRQGSKNKFDTVSHLGYITNNKR